MGVTGFYPWLTKIGYVPKKIYFQFQTDTILIDAKPYMYRYLYGIDANETDPQVIVDQLVDHIAHSLSKFPPEHITFCNDGVTRISGMKSNTLLERQTTRERAQKKVKLLEDKKIELKTQLADMNIKPDVDTTNQEPLDAAHISSQSNVDTQPDINQEETNKRKRMELLEQLDVTETKLQQSRKNARHVSTECSMQVLAKLKERGFQTIQCDGEADVELAEFSSRYTYVLGDDADLLVRGVNNLLRDFNKQNTLYNASEIRKLAKLSCYQLKTIVCLAGCDYVDGIAKMGVITAHEYVVKYVHFDNMWKEIAKKFKVTEEQKAEIQKAILEF